MVDAGSRRLSDITFEDVTDLLEEQPELRTAVIRHLAAEHGRDLVRFVRVVAEPSPEEPEEKY